jgi:Ca-activated chloride channel family protein
LPVLATLAALLAAALAELLHARRVRRVAALAFGPGGRPALWARAAPLVRVLASGSLAFGLATLLVLEPKKHTPGEEGAKPRAGDVRHVLLVLDVSPSMRLVDAGPTKKESRMQRAAAVLESFFRRVPLELYRLSVVATYNGAKPVVVDTSDVEVVRNVLGDLPLHFAFPAGKTKIFDGLEEAARLADGWNPGSTTLILVSDGDTVPSKGMPRMPKSVRDVLVIGVGDPVNGKFIDGRQSRQDVATLRQIAARLNGTFHNGNELHLASSLVSDLAGSSAEGLLADWGLREAALAACASGALGLALLPLLLQLFGSAWRPGVRRRRGADPAPWRGGLTALGASMDHR